MAADEAWRERALADEEPTMRKALLAVALGGLITYVDSRPSWDDRVTAAAVLVVSGLFGFLGPARPWLWAVCVGVWIPLLGLVRAGNYATLLALAVAFVGAHGGRAIRTWLSLRPR